MGSADDDIAITPVDRAIERLRAIYRGWTRDTTVAQMRSDWDLAFAGCSVPVAREPVSAGGVDGEWLVPTDAPRDKAILYFHGGGFRIGSVASHRDLAARIADASGCRVLSINYRLAPEHRFPAALEDALIAYQYLRDQGLDPANIAFAGDSAGGNLVLCTMLAARDRGLPLPAAGALMSPWTDLTASGASYQSRAEADPIHQRAMILALAKNYLGKDGDGSDPFASPLFADLTGLPPLLVQVGDRETVRDDATELAARAKAAGIDVELQVWDGMIHVFQMFPEIPQAREAIASLAAFLRNHLHIGHERAPQ
ncbi:MULTISPECIES: alpha/beta hydrolase [Bradyrhizobium]|jgi:epsilon-lactone hydrolase|uniref:alpha/beta hydrolase n=1 Tax=Bradyrhizobium TaxID=374 RepID=UPI0004BAE8D7|nr:MULTISPECIES: alpha/beta hydrolase [Bradyrhizobium]MCS3447472.1 acetyl esterase/lipase [Bradyrhizobium elkanii]MCS3561389.1 acetyl esterase/lipase [Bradyrhizobium elkanii]MCW2148768.1 acetyl esterase/lipase [Bradyrhizobium elkanii]MCW2352144.1 acetyl esterase/lipase [Bradyrhizobium elkanii]MCW2372497.1 acetyl esterase/lipase [Bradyrhizobium elkanii]